MSKESSSSVKVNEFALLDVKTGEFSPAVIAKDGTVQAPKVRRRFEGLATYDDRGRPGYFLHYTVMLGESETQVFEKIEDKQGLAMVDDWVHGKGVFAPRKFVPRSPEGVGAPR